jgi:protein SCO1/2
MKRFPQIKRYSTLPNKPKMYLKSLGLFCLTGAGLFGYFYNEKQKIELLKKQAINSGIGTPKVGGPFNLVNQFGQLVSNQDYLGKYMLIYFGYTFCPDVCPEELEKMAETVDILDKKGFSDKIVPIFISCDPKRDSIASIRQYVKDFHPRFVGLTGTYNQIKSTAKAFRLYFSAPPRALDDDEADYLVDHSIFFYLMGPDGKFIQHFGRDLNSQEMADKILGDIESRSQSK